MTDVPVATAGVEIVPIERVRAFSAGVFRACVPVIRPVVDALRHVAERTVVACPEQEG